MFAGRSRKERLPASSVRLDASRTLEGLERAAGRRRKSRGGNKMVDVIEITDRHADEHIARHFGRSPIVVQLPTVFAIVAPATYAGARLLDRCKDRLPGKYYSVLIGDLAQYLRLSPDALLSQYLLDAARPDRMRAFAMDLENTFLRTQISARACSSQTICEGRVQGLIMGGLLEEKMRLMETLTQRLIGKLFGSEHGHYCAPIASSCNMSGDPAGSIDDLGRALDFANRRGVGLVLTNASGTGGGSNPIFGIAGAELETLRDGPGMSEKRRLLERWLRCAGDDRLQQAAAQFAPFEPRDSFQASA